ncbi:UNVERIFIED_CONTAM: GIY-YIG nuclease family protein [Aerococcus urinaeequi]
MKLHYFYVLACSDNTLYTGYTTDPDRREKVHNQGRGAKYTQAARRRPVHMVYSKPFTSKSRAMSAEYRFKQLTRHQKENFLKERGVKQVWPPSMWSDRVADSVESGLPFLPEEEKAVKDEE